MVPGLLYIFVLTLTHALPVSPAASSPSIWLIAHFVPPSTIATSYYTGSKFQNLEKWKIQIVLNETDEMELVNCIIKLIKDKQ